VNPARFSRSAPVRSLLRDLVSTASVAAFCALGYVSVAANVSALAFFGGRLAEGWTILEIVLYAQRRALERLDKLSRSAVPMWHNIRGISRTGKFQQLEGVVVMQHGANYR
jgi:hypothetical protein